MFKKIVEVGLKKEYKEDDKLKLWVTKIIALALIPTEKVLDAFVRLSEDEIVDNYDLSVFLDYITIIYVDDDEALFPISYRNHWDNEEDRTNNKFEGYNLKLNLYLNSHPIIWKFIVKIKSEETNANLAYTRINNETYKHRRRNKVDFDRYMQLINLKCLFLEKKINIDELKELSLHIVNDPLKD